MEFSVVCSGQMEQCARFHTTETEQIKRMIRSEVSDANKKHLDWTSRRFPDDMVNQDAFCWYVCPNPSPLASETSIESCGLIIIYSGSLMWKRAHISICREQTTENSIQMVSAMDEIKWFLFLEEDDDFKFLAVAASIFARRDVNQIRGYFEQTIGEKLKYSLNDFKTHFRM